MFDPEKVGDIGPYVMNEYNQTLRAVTRSDYDQLLELYKDVTHLLEQHKKSHKETGTHFERLHKLLPGRYVGWHYVEASADYIEKLKALPENGRKCVDHEWADTGGELMCWPPIKVYTCTVCNLIGNVTGRQRHPNDRNPEFDISTITYEGKR